MFVADVGGVGVPDKEFWVTVNTISGGYIEMLAKCLICSNLVLAVENFSIK